MAEGTEGFVRGIIVYRGVFVEVAAMEVFVPDESYGARLVGEGERGEPCRLGREAWGCGFAYWWARIWGFSAVPVSGGQVLREKVVVM